MIKLLRNLPNDSFGIACSGGLDSMVALHFCVKGGRTPKIFCFDHGIIEDVPGFQIVKDYCVYNNLELNIGKISTPYAKGFSREAHWRTERYRWLNSYNIPIITGHHLNDVMETWVFSAINGTPKLIPYQTNNIIRPFLMNLKQELREWAEKERLVWHDDCLNTDLSFSRNRIRHKIMPEILQVNKGFHSLIRKKLVEKYEKN